MADIVLSRMHKAHMPEKGQITTARLFSVEGTVTYVKLLEYNDDQYLIPYTNLGITIRKDETIMGKFKQAYGTQFPVHIVNVDLIQNFIDIDMSVSEDQAIAAKASYIILKQINEFVRQLAGSFKISKLSMETIYAWIIWELQDPISTLQTTIDDDAFISILQPLISNFYSSIDTRASSDQYFRDSVPQQAFIDQFRGIQKNRFELKSRRMFVELKLVSKWSILGIEAIKQALSAGEEAAKQIFTPNLVQKEQQIQVTVLTSPNYVAELYICKKDAGKEILEKFLEVVEKELKKSNADFECKGGVKEGREIK
ncbi:Eukaryotic translation initiation factor 2 alpha subunit [Spironucleus salmonicida]|uniref:Eukaryotic translation initiation factor 2 alpha subunit n=1 Tax=Spironucleus salmonicida TaxID=348837 RepID=V6LW02_9EUKA|nr:Eukaryotic translation initiation factor 2 alpha subunit [Spironucleus salmonicida]|eukprot:EST48428.1 Eukaryotic translation initiation factor 2 alpha subunit [Spironucleus salmonicida]